MRNLRTHKHTSSNSTVSSRAALTTPPTTAPIRIGVLSPVTQLSGDSQVREQASHVIANIHVPVLLRGGLEGEPVCIVDVGVSPVTQLSGDSHVREHASHVIANIPVLLGGGLDGALVEVKVRLLRDGPLVVTTTQREAPTPLAGWTSSTAGITVQDIHVHVYTI